jgi:NADPH2:quinone reductase
MRQRVATEIKSTFASHFTAELSLDEALTLEAIGKYSQQATGEKYFINPNKPLPLAKI